MDKVTLEDTSADYALIELLGPTAAAVMQNAGLVLPASDTSLETFAGVPARLLRRTGGWRLLLPASAATAATHLLGAAGAQALTPESYNIWRVEAGLPEAGFEWVDEYTPLETGLVRAVSDSKGCYTGQEVIARQITYDKVTRQLAGLQLSAPAQLGERVYPLDGEAPAGVITSTAQSPRFGPIALAVLKRPHHLPGTAVSLGAPSNERRGHVTGLPFRAD